MDERQQAHVNAEKWLEAASRMGGPDPDSPEVVLARQFIRVSEALAYVNICLDKSVELQSHYANLLNQYDGGKRMMFKNGDAWMIRLRSLESKKQEAGACRQRP